MGITADDIKIAKKDEIEAIQELEEQLVQINCILFELVAARGSFSNTGPYKEYFEQRENERLIRSRQANTVKTAGLKIIQPYEGLSGVQ